MNSNNIFLEENDYKYFYLKTEKLELKDKYNDIYHMKYVDNITTLIPQNTNNINEYSNIKVIYTYNELINIIKIKFSTENMLKYFGNKNNLNCKETRHVYKNLIDYFLNLFLYKMNKITNININNKDDNNPYICLIAECLNIIRASIKKYIRLRTSDTQVYYCKKEHLEKRDKKEYGCSIPVKEFEYCPSFKYLREEKKKTCKNILYKSLSTNDMYTLLSDIFILPVRKVKTIKIQKEGSRYTKQKGTRKIYRGMPIVLKKYKKKTLKKSKSKSKTNHNNHNNTINNVNLNNDNINNININNLKINSNNE